MKKWYLEFQIAGTWYRSPDALDTAGMMRCLRIPTRNGNGEIMPTRAVFVAGA